MESHSLENCIATLQKLRDAYHSRLDASVLAELDDVIADLKKVESHKEGKAKLNNLSLRALQVISCVISLVTNVKDLMK